MSDLDTIFHLHIPPLIYMGNFKNSVIFGAHTSQNQSKLAKNTAEYKATGVVPSMRRWMNVGCTARRRTS